MHDNNFLFLSPAVSAHEHMVYYKSGEENLIKGNVTQSGGTCGFYAQNGAKKMETTFTF